MYQSLYRKYRPNKLEDYVGQNIAVKIIKNSLINNKVNHAYLFSGPRGTGKTTMAKLLAKSVNCLNPENGIACEQCKNCIDINNGSAVDIIEIDAASNNGVDEIREIRNNVALSCSSLKYKIYIVDEVHMLTIGAFNALLKTLEEPPEHIIFILATTDIQKVPSTILSRCQCINFESISEKDIASRLKYICNSESVLVDDEVLEKIADISNGGLRDAIGNLEKLISAEEEKGKSINLEQFNNVFGFVDTAMLNNFFENLTSGNISNLLELSDQLYNSGKNFVLFTKELIEYIRKKINEHYKNKNSYCVYCDYIFKLNELSNTLKTTDNIKAIFEAGIIKITGELNPDNIKVETNIKENDVVEVKQETKEQQTDDKKEKTKTTITEEKVEVVEQENDKLKIVQQNNDIIMNNAFALANKEDLNNIKNNWKMLNEYLLDKNIGSFACYLVDGNIRVCGKDNIIISYEYSSMVDRGLDMYKDLVNVMEKVFNTKYNISIVTDEKWNEEKNKYINNLKNNVKYNLKDLIEEKVDDNNSSLDEASLIFGEDIVEIR